MVSYRLPPELVAELKAPLGTLYPGEDPAVPLEAGSPLISVGDVTTANLLAAGLQPEVAIVDHHTQRGGPVPSQPEPADPEGSLVLAAENPPGTLSEGLWETLVTALNHPGPVRLEVEGEEDLATLAAVALAPEGAQVAYGQPSEGMVVVTVTPAQRAKAYQLLAKMEEC